VQPVLLNNPSRVAPAQPLLIASDWNGTLVQDSRRAWRATQRVLAAYGQPSPSLSTFRDSFQLPVSTWLATLGIPGHLLETAEELWNAALTAGEVTLAPGGMTLLAAAHAAGTPVVIISGAARNVVVQDATRLGVLSLLGAIHAPSHPKNEALRRLRTQYPSHQLIYVGDTEYDIRQGQLAGATSVAVTYGYSPAHKLRQARPDLVVDSLDELWPART